MKKTPKFDKDGFCDSNCPYLNDVSNSEKLEATCQLTGKELIFYDWWNATCPNAYKQFGSMPESG